MTGQIVAVRLSGGAQYKQIATIAASPALFCGLSLSPRDLVVWLNHPTGACHYRGERWYGRTKHGTCVCEKEAIADGDRASENGQ
jgi:hypothetical protein